MTAKTKKHLININLFIIVIALGFFMYWQKQVKANQTKISSKTELSSTFHQNLTNVFFEE